MDQNNRDYLNDARDSLSIARKLSNQSAYARRQPDPESLPHYANARELLEAFLSKSPEHREALLLLSEISESTLDFDSALHFLDRAFRAGEPRSKKLLKKLALIRESQTMWRDLVISPSQLRELGDYLDAHGVNTSNNTFDLTRAWLAENDVDHADAIIDGLERQGAFSDFQVLANLVDG